VVNRLGSSIRGFGRIGRVGHGRTAIVPPASRPRTDG
jgi:hypothetical protein